jgi:hypothetical protein
MMDISKAQGMALHISLNLDLHFICRQFGANSFLKEVIL